MRKILLTLAIIAFPFSIALADIDSGDGLVHLKPCAVKSQHCIRIIVDNGVTNISNFWLLQGHAQAQEYGANYPAQWGIDSPLDVEVTSTSGDWPTTWGNGSSIAGLVVYYSNYSGTVGWAAASTPAFFNFINGCPTYGITDVCSPPPVGGATTTIAASFGVTPFLLVSTLLFCVELIGYLILAYIIVIIIGWPIKRLVRSMRLIIRRR